jgi:hypothetical protein
MRQTAEAGALLLFVVLMYLIAEIGSIVGF